MIVYKKRSIMKAANIITRSRTASTTSWHAFAVTGKRVKERNEKKVRSVRGALLSCET
jgi:hypothetical protein